MPWPPVPPNADTASRLRDCALANACGDGASPPDAPGLKDCSGGLLAEYLPGAGEKASGENESGEKESGENESGEKESGENESGENESGEKESG